MSAPRHLEWLNGNSNRSYPLRNSGAKKDTTDSLEFPSELILDAVFTVADVDLKLYVKSLYIYDIGIVIRIHDYVTDVLVTSLSIDIASHVLYDSYILSGVGDYKSVQGKIVVGNLESLSSTAIGTFEYSKEDTIFESSVLIPSLRGVSSLGVNDNSTILIGDVKLKPGFNFRLRVNKEENAIYFDAIEGQGLGVECPCEEDEPRTPIYTFNGMYADDSGNINIKGTGCIEMGQVSNGLTVSNICEALCCECDDVNALLAALAANNLLLVNLDKRVNTLEVC